jgi:hypothetical protein
MVESSSVTVFAAIGAVFIGFKVLTLLKTLFDTYLASGVCVSRKARKTRVINKHNETHYALFPIAQEVRCW